MTDIAPFVSKILIYPVKALDGVECPYSMVLPTGALAFDRRWAMVDERGGFVNGKRHAAVHRLRLTFDAARRTLALWSTGDPTAPVSFDPDADRAALEAWLSDRLGLAVALRDDSQQGFPDDPDSPGPTVISVATPEAIGVWFDLPVDQLRARLRTNIEIEGVPAFWEDRLFGPAGTTVGFAIGDVPLEGVNPCQRCIVPTRDPITGRADGTFARRFADLRKRTLPSWSTRERFNHFYRAAVNTRLLDAGSSGWVRVGDPLAIIDGIRTARRSRRP